MKKAHGCVKVDAPAAGLVLCLQVAIIREPDRIWVSCNGPGPSHLLPWLHVLASGSPF